MTRVMRGVLLLTVVASALSGGCGFQLQGAEKLPASMSVAHIAAADAYTPFYRQLRAALQNGGATVAATAANAGAVIRIDQDNTGQRVLSVSGRNVPREYEVYYTLRYSVISAGKTVLEQQNITLTRDYTYDERLVLGKAAEEDEIREDLARDLVGLVMRRLASLP
jgi:LPS-assembly lipoprotein